MSHLATGARALLAASLLVAALAVLAETVAPAAADAASSGDPRPRPMLVAVSASGGVSLTPKGTAVAELPWLSPGDVDPAISPDGAMLAFASARDGDYDVFVADARSGKVHRLTAAAADERRPVWSPDGQRLAWTSGDADDSDIWVGRIDGTVERLLVGGPGAQVDPAWSPDGRRVAYASLVGGNHDLFTVPSAGGRPVLLLDAKKSLRAPAWHPSGTRLAVVVGTEPRTELGIVQARSGALRVVTRTPASERRPVWAPAGRSLVVEHARRGLTALWFVRVDGKSAAIPGSDGLRGPDLAVASPLLAPGPDLDLPDLDQQAPTGLRVTRDEDGRVLLGFDSSVDSLGPGTLRIRGSRRPGEPEMRADQIVEGRGGTTLVVEGVGRLAFEPHPPHEHWHLQPFVRFQLRDPDDQSVVAADRKSGFCLIDRYGRASKKVASVRKPRFVGDCGKGDRAALVVEQGSSPGYVDRYPAFFHGQDVDVTDVPPGLYVLVHVANPDRTMRETRYGNNAASTLIRLTAPRGPGGLPGVTVLRRCPETETCPTAPPTR